MSRLGLSSGLSRVACRLFPIAFVFVFVLYGLRNADSAQIVCSFLGGKFDYSRHANVTVATNMTTADLHVSCAFYLKTQTLPLTLRHSGSSIYQAEGF